MAISICAILFFADNEFGEKTVSILLDDDEASIIFIDHPFSEMSVSIRIALNCRIGISASVANGTSK